MEYNLLDIVWTMVAAFLVYFMQAGFAMVETGFNRAKNAGNIVMKNMMDFVIGSIAFFLIGFGLMFGQGNGIIGLLSQLVMVPTNILKEGLGKRNEKL